MFGTFLSNSQLEREHLHCSSKTNAIWDAVQLNKGLFVNRGYQPEDKVIEFDAMTFNFRLWRTYYLRWQEYKYHELGNELDLQELTYSLNFASAAASIDMPEFSLKKKKKITRIARRSRRITNHQKRKKKPKFERSNQVNWKE